MIAAILSLLTLGGMAGAGAALSPSFTLALPGGVAWAELIGPPGRAVLVAAERDGGVRIVEPATGDELLSSPLTTGGLQPGSGYTRLPDGGFRFYLYTPFELHAVTVSRARAVRVVSLRAFVVTDRRQDDPEYLRRLVHVAALGESVLAVRDDGLLIRYHLGRREVGRELALGSLANQRYDTCGRDAVLLWKQGAAAYVQFFRQRRELPARPPQRLGDAMPAWSTLTSAGLVAVWLDRAELHTRTAGQVATCPLPATPRIATLAVHVEGDGGAVIIAFSDVAGRLHLLDLMAGERTWGDADAGTGEPLQPVDRLELARGRLIVARGSSVAVHDVVSGDALGTLDVPGVPQAMNVGQGAAWVLSVAGETPWLSRVPLGLDDGAAVSQRLSGPPPRSVLWAPGGCILVADQRLSGYLWPQQGG